MLTFVITPYEKNLPLLSADYMYILGTRKIYLEFYDLVENKDDNYTLLLSKLKSTMENYANLEDIEASDAWYDHLLTVTTYKTGKPKDDKTFNALLTDNLQVYSDFAKSLPQGGCVYHRCAHPQSRVRVPPLSIPKPART